MCHTQTTSRVSMKTQHNSHAANRKNCTRTETCVREVKKGINSKRHAKSTTLQQVLSSLASRTLHCQQHRCDELIILAVQRHWLPQTTLSPFKANDARLLPVNTCFRPRRCDINADCQGHDLQIALDSYRMLGYPSCRVHSKTELQ